MKLPLAKMVKYSVLIVFALFLFIQAVPYGRNHDNPAVIREPNWDSPKTRTLAKRACFDCHSNETIWPWYTWIAPFSWLVRRDVTEGREELNFSEWQGGRRKGERPAEMAEQVNGGEMPPLQYRLVHADARLTGEEKRQLVDGLTATLLHGGS